MTDETKDRPDKAGNPNWPRWWTVRDVAEYRGITERTVWRYVAQAKKLRKESREGGIPFSQPRGTGALRFKSESIKRFFDDGGED
jgi:hypothetical protein